MRLLLVLAATVFLAEEMATLAETERPRSRERCFELRTYQAAPGKMEALQARFRDHTTRLFQKHGMTLVGFWVREGDENKLIYILAHESREAAARSFKAFRADPEWLTAKAESERSGSLTTRVESVFLAPTDYSPLK